MTTLADLREYCQDHWNDHVDAKAIRVFDRMINRAQRDIAMEHRWSWYLEQAYIRLKAPFTTGTITLTLDSPTVVLAGGSWPAASEIEGQFLVPSADTEVDFEVLSRDSASNITLALDWHNTTVAGNSYKLYFGKYQLPADFMAMDEGDLENQNWIDYLDPTHFKQYKLSTRDNSGDALFFTIFGHDDQIGVGQTPGPVIQVYPYPDIDTIWQFNYYRWPRELVNATDVMDWPETQVALVFSALDMMIAKKKRHETLSYGDAFQAFQNNLRRMKGVDSGRQMGRVHYRLRGRSIAPGITPRIANRGRFTND